MLMLGRLLGPRSRSFRLPAEKLLQFVDMFRYFFGLGVKLLLEWQHMRVDMFEVMLELLHVEGLYVEEAVTLREEADDRLLEQRDKVQKESVVFLIFVHNKIYNQQMLLLAQN